MKLLSNIRSQSLAFFACASLMAVPRQSQAAGIMIITHGLNGNVDEWIIPMADRIPEHPNYPGLDFSCYEIYFAESGNGFVVSQRFLGGALPESSDTGEILVKLDWSQLANNSYSTYQVAAMVLPRLLEPGFIPALGGRPIVAWPLHVVGHSRGGSLVCELSRLLGQAGIGVDQVTTLDPHPLNNDGFSDWPYTVMDATATTYENVLFADNYYQTSDFLIQGKAILGAYVRRLTSLSGGYGGLGGAHSDVHLWYHGTIDLLTPASDGFGDITSAERGSWWTQPEESGARAGFYYSRLGGGDRLSTNAPAGAGTSRIRDGMNQVWEFGAGVGVTNRTRLMTNAGLWPNLIQFELTGTNRLFFGETIAALGRYQFAQDATQPVTFRFYLDPDANPLNENETFLAQTEDTGTGRLEVRTVPWEISTLGVEVPEGPYHERAEISTATSARHLDLDSLVILENADPPPNRSVLTALGWSDTAFLLRVEGEPGLTIVVEVSPDMNQWTPLATNRLEEAEWIVEDTDAGTVPHRFYRARQ